MSEIKMKGRLLYFDKIDWMNSIGILFPKNCDLTYPEIVPVVWNFDFHNPDSICGHAIVTNDELGLVCEAVMFKSAIVDIMRVDKEFGIGGYYNKVKEDLSKSGVRTIQSCHLAGIGLTLGPVNEDYKLALVEESEEK